MKPLSIRKSNPSFLLMYSALQYGPEEMAKPDGSLSLPYVAGALRRAGYDVRILDVSVGNCKDSLQESFFRTRSLPTGLIRVGISRERVEEEIAGADVVGISSIFTTQTKMVFELAGWVKDYDPNKLVIAGGVNARSLRSRFFDAGVDVIMTGEADFAVIELAEAIRGKKDLRDVNGIAFRDADGNEVLTPPAGLIQNLDDLAMPAWDMLPLAKYWEISRPHGGEYTPGTQIRYASLQTSRGCPFACTYCHISKEDELGVTGGIGSLRLHSVERVLQELQTLKDLRAEYIFFEDDSLLAKKNRATLLFREAAKMGLKLADVNGVNIIHLLKNVGGELVPDHEFLAVMAAAGFKWLHLPFESGNERLLRQYSTGKWSIERTDTEALIRACNDAGISVAGNYIIGYPDEKIGEIYTTIRMAKRHVEQGLNHAAIFALVPFPGTKVYDQVVESGQLDPDFDTDQMKWTKSMLKGLAVPPEALEYMRQLAWLTVNRSSFVEYKIGQRVTAPVEG
jgi:radical SAM superfamily enzyme YgiQ (UPF0313 family)